MPGIDEGQYELLADRLDFLDGRITALEDSRDREADTHHERSSYRLEAWVLAVVVIEAVFGALLYFRHG
jgi:hypothetical protein